MPLRDEKISVIPAIPGTLSWLVALVILLVISQFNYVVFHTAAETLTIAIASGIFVLAWYSRERMDNDFLLYMGTALFFYAVIAFVHMLSFKGMEVLGGDGNFGISLTVASRYFIALSLLTGLVFIRRRLWPVLAVAVYATLTVLILLSVFVWQNFPTSYIDGVGVTPFKTLANLGTLPLLALSVLLMRRYRDRFDQGVFRLLIAATVLHMAANTAFAVYDDAYDVWNLIGHLYQATAFYFMFLAVVDVGLSRPQDIMFRRLTESERTAVEATKHLEQEVELRTADLQSAKQDAEFVALQMKTIAETAADAIVCVDGAMQVVYWNRGAERLTGYTATEATGIHLRDLLPDSHLEEYAEVLEHLGEGGGDPVPGGSVRVSVRGKGGAMIPAEAALSYWSLDGKRYATLIGRDLTDRLKTEQELRTSAERMAGVLRAVVETMGSAVEARDPYTQGHQRGVAKVSTLIAREMGLHEQQVANIEIAALVHDIGKLAVPATILNKPGPLTELEYEIVKEHPRAGYEILRHIDFGAPIAEIVLQHHERMDGTGYPSGLTSESIFLPSRVLMLADVIEAICSTRPYRPGRTIEEAMAEVRENPGRYDPDVAAACERLYASRALSDLLCSVL